MGGFGSLYYGMKYPDMFCYIYACSSGVNLPDTPDLTTVFEKDNLPGISIEIGTEDFLYQQVDTFEKLLTSAGVNHEYIVRSGSHNWEFWRGCTPKLIEKTGAILD